MPEVASIESCRRAGGTAAAAAIPHAFPNDKVTKMTDSCRKTLSEGHHDRRSESFKSSLGHTDVERSEGARLLRAGQLGQPPSMPAAWPSSASERLLGLTFV
jgi:hypothetical protein